MHILPYLLFVQNGKACYRLRREWYTLRKMHSIANRHWVCRVRDSCGTFDVLTEGPTSNQTGPPAVCQACEKHGGFSALDTARYKCSRCGRVCGQLRFKPTQLKNHKARNNSLTCLDCRANTREYTPSHRILALAGVSRGNAKQLSCKCKRVLHAAYYFEHPRKRTKKLLIPYHGCSACKSKYTVGGWLPCHIWSFTSLLNLSEAWNYCALCGGAKLCSVLADLRRSP